MTVTQNRLKFIKAGRNILYAWCAKQREIKIWLNFCHKQKWQINRDFSMREPLRWSGRIRGPCGRRRHPHHRRQARLKWELDFKTWNKRRRITLEDQPGAKENTSGGSAKEDLLKTGQILPESSGAIFADGNLFDCFTFFLYLSKLTHLNGTGQLTKHVRFRLTFWNYYNVLIFPRKSKLSNFSLSPRRW